MQPGQANTLVRILQRSATEPLAQPAGSWNDVGTCWADVRYQTGLQRLSADQLQSTGTRCSVRTRQTSCTRAVVRGQRLRIAGADYTIVDILPQGRDLIDFIGEVVR